MFHFIVYLAPTSDKANLISLTKDQEKASCSTLSDDILFVVSEITPLTSNVFYILPVLIKLLVSKTF